MESVSGFDASSAAARSGQMQVYGAVSWQINGPLIFRAACSGAQKLLMAQAGREESRKQADEPHR